MAVWMGIVAVALLVSSCTGVRSVQLHPPTAPPMGMVWGYGVEKLKGKNAETSRQAAYLKAIDDLLTRGPVVVSKTVHDRTTVLDVRPASRTMESTFRLRASRMLQPSFMDTGVEHGFVWVLVATTDEDIERGWQQFVEWRAQKIEQAQQLFADARGPEKLSLLKASFALLEEAGAADDPGLLYYQVKSALDAELARVAHLERLQRDFRNLADNGQLLAAENTLDQALQSGLDRPAYQRCKMEVSDRRHQAGQLISAGDDLLQDREYKEALKRYQQAQKLDRDNPQLPSKLALAERYDRESRAQNAGVSVGAIVPAATRALGEYFAYKREEERRKREEAEKEAAEAKQREQEAARPSERRQPPRVSDRVSERTTDRVSERVSNQVSDKPAEAPAPTPPPPEPAPSPEPHQKAESKIRRDPKMPAEP